MWCMFRRLGRWLCSVFVTGVCALPGFAQQPGQGGATEPLSHPTPVLQHALAIIGALIVLIIICMPSRKR